jgi:hypothetical protein
MMDYKLSKDDLDVIDNAQNDEVHCWLKTNGTIKCSVGDILLKMYDVSDGGGVAQWSYQEVPEVKGVKQRYIVVHVDDYGIYYAKSISIKGLIEKDVLIESSDCGYGNDKFVHDTLFIDNSLMGEKALSLADFYTAEVEKNKQLILMNKKAAATNGSSIAEINKFLLSLNKGDIFFRSIDLQGNRIEEYKVISTPTIISRLDLSDRQTDISKTLIENNVTKIVRVKLKVQKHNMFYYSYNFKTVKLFKNKPIIMDSL